MTTAINESLAHITCACGAKIQVLNDAGTDWDEAATSAAVQAHEADCTDVQGA